MQEYIRVNQNPSHDSDFHRLLKEGLYQAAKDEQRQRKKAPYPKLKQQKKKGRGYKM